MYICVDIYIWIYIYIYRNGTGARRRRRYMSSRLVFSQAGVLATRRAPWCTCSQFGTLGYPQALASPRRDRWLGERLARDLGPFRAVFRCRCRLADRQLLHRGPVNRQHGFEPSAITIVGLQLIAMPTAEFDYGLPPYVLDPDDTKEGRRRARRAAELFSPAEVNWDEVPLQPLPLTPGAVPSAVHNPFARRHRRARLRRMNRERRAIERAALQDSPAGSQAHPSSCQSQRSL